MSLQADTAYRRTEVELEELERVTFQALRGSVPDYYRDGRDDTLWGRQLRAAARLMAQGDFQTQYLLAGTNPEFLNPADLLRQFGDLLKLNRNYPGTTQSDLEFKAMVLKLLEAYRLGATTESLRLVLEAYTGTSFTLEELFKAIPTGGDPSDRNAIRVGLGVGVGATGISGAVVKDLTRVRDIVKDLYTAIDLAKPAHVGINLTTVLRDSAEPITVGVRDDLTITARFHEAEPGEPLLYEAPFMDAATPHTGLGPEIRQFTYQWYRNGEVIPAATLPDYILTASLADAGAHFDVVVADPTLGSCRSDAAILTVSPTGTDPLSRAVAALPSVVPPTGSLRITTQPSSRSVLEGQQVILQVAVRNTVVPGILGPHLNRCWEVADDILIGLDHD